MPVCSPIQVGNHYHSNRHAAPAQIFQIFLTGSVHDHRLVGQLSRGITANGANIPRQYIRPIKWFFHPRCSSPAGLREDATEWGIF